MSDYLLNFGSYDNINDNIYENIGYCLLVGYVFMNILFTNIVMYKKLPFNATHKQVFDFINNMKQYCLKYFKDDNKRNDKLWKFKLICYNYEFKVLKMQFDLLVYHQKLSLLKNTRNLAKKHVIQ